MKPTVYFATDHAGFMLKEQLIAYVHGELGYEVVDCGAYELDPLDDFPDFIKEAAAAVSEDPESRRAIILGGSGQGEAMLANRFPQVRAAVYYGGAASIPRLSREHNDANILSLGARFLTESTAQEAVRMWLETDPLTDEKYQRRNQKITEITESLP